MYCNCYMKVEDCVAVVTEMDFSSDNKNVRILAGYAFDPLGKPVNFWKFINKEFVDDLVRVWNL